MGNIVSSAITNDVANSGKAVRRATITFSSSYATGGDTLDIANLGLRQVDTLYVNGALATFGYHAQLAGTAQIPKVKLIKGSTTPAEETAATNVSTVTAQVEFHGFG